MLKIRAKEEARIKNVVILIPRIYTISYRSRQVLLTLNSLFLLEFVSQSLELGSIPRLSLTESSTMIVNSQWTLDCP